MSKKQQLKESIVPFCTERRLLWRLMWKGLCFPGKGEERRTPTPPRKGGRGEGKRAEQSTTSQGLPHFRIPTLQPLLWPHTGGCGPALEAVISAPAVSVALSLQWSPQLETKKRGWLLGSVTPTVYLSSTEVRLSISVITSAISYFSLCKNRRKKLEGGGLYLPLLDSEKS